MTPPPFPISLLGIPTGAIAWIHGESKKGDSPFNGN